MQEALRERYAKRKEDRRSIGSSPVYWGEYAFQYIKGKWFKIYQIRDGKNNVRTIGENGEVLSKYDKTIMIYDTFSFYQQGLSKVAEGMVKAGRATPGEAAYLDAMKKLRDDPEKWAEQDNEAIKRYTSSELRLLARETGVLCQAFIDMDNMRLQSWHDPAQRRAPFSEGARSGDSPIPMTSGRMASRRGKTPRITPTMPDISK